MAGYADAVRCTLLGVGAMNSPRYRPAALLVEFKGGRVMFDGGTGATPQRRFDAWLVCDDKAELIGKIRARARALGTVARVGDANYSELQVKALPVVHTSHPTYGYLIRAEGTSVVWAPEFLVFPGWASGANLMFAEAAGWKRPIRFAHGAGGHSAALNVAQDAKVNGVRRLVLAHIGRPTIRAMDAGESPPFGEFGVEGRVYRVRL
jgi:ribonuclease BN (tRNA processing enzyme)